MSNEPRFTLAGYRSRFGTYSWSGQSLQYDQLGAPGEIVYQRYSEDGQQSSVVQGTYIDTLLWYDTKGKLGAILNHYPHGAVEINGGNVLETPGAVNTFVRPAVNKDTDAGLLDLYAEAKRRWPNCYIKPDEHFSVIQSPTVVDSADYQTMRRMIADVSGHRGDGLDGNRRRGRG